eukprot:scaffold2.g7476.t1
MKPSRQVQDQQRSAFVWTGLPARRSVLPAARVFGGPGPESNRKTLKREEEPDEYWTSKGERAGSNPMKDPLAWIGLLAIFAPFIILAVAISFGLVDLSGGR